MNPIQPVLAPRLAADPIELVAMRSLDIAIAAAGLLFLAPLLLLISLAVFLFDPGPILFTQRRIGFDGREFPCYKFRSMATDADRRLEALLATCPASLAEWQRDHKLKKDPRIVGIGAFLRKSSLDELPQLFNVLRGDMTLVGPRPIVRAEIVRYGRYFEEYCRVRPGITGLWQISGRSATSYRRRVALDVIYVRSRCLKLYLKILFMTVPSVLLVRGAV